MSIARGGRETAKLSRRRPAGLWKIQRGVTLVELMVAMLIGTILMAAALAVFVESRHTARINQSIARIQENALFAADELSRSLELAGYWGQRSDASIVNNRTQRANGAVASASALNAAQYNCTNGYQWYTDLERPVEGIDTDGTVDANDADRYSTCIPDSTYMRTDTVAAATDDTPFDASDILVVRFVEPEPVATLVANTPYIRSNPTASALFVGTTPPAGVTGQNYRLRTYAYYVSSYHETPGDGIPTLKRASIEPSAGGIRVIPGASGVEDIVIPGIESFHVQFGVDTDSDGSADQYLNANNVAAAAWNDVVAVRYWLIARGEEPETDLIQESSFSLPHGVVNISVTAANLGSVDSFRRVRVTRTVQLRNSARS